MNIQASLYRHNQLAQTCHRARLPFPDSETSDTLMISMGLIGGSILREYVHFLCLYPYPPNPWHWIKRYILRIL